MTIKKTLVLVQIVIMVGVGRNVFAYKPTLLSTDFLSVRQAGMGKAYTAIANDETLLKANPAGIGLRKMFMPDKTNSVFYFLPLKVGFSPLVFDYLRGEVERGPGKIDISFGFENMPLDIVYAGNFWAISFLSTLYGNFLFDRSDENRIDNSKTVSITYCMI